MDHVAIFDELYEIVSQGDLSTELNLYLKTLPDVDRFLKHFYHRNCQQINLLILAALNGYQKMIEVLISHSSNVKQLVELSGEIQGINGNWISGATALWCACDRKHYTSARTLIELGRASVYHGPRNPLLIDAVINERFDTIDFLLENNYVNINRVRNVYDKKYNSLMLAAFRGQTKMVAYLIEKGAQINYKTKSFHNTALACAAMSGNLDVVKLLCSLGALTNVKNSNGDTPLKLAYRYGHSEIVDYLLELTDNQDLSVEELELMACSFIIEIDESNDTQIKYMNMVNFMRKIFNIRKIRNYPKRIQKPSIAYNYEQECQTIEEFDQIQQDYSRLYIEALLIRERILKPLKTTALCESLLVYGEKLIENGEFERCLHIWEHTFHLYQSMGYETSLHRFVWLLCRMIIAKTYISVDLFLKICRLSFEPSEQIKKNHSIKNALCFIVIATKILNQYALTRNEHQSIYQWICQLCYQRRTTTDGETLLHLCVSDKTHRDINYRASDIRQVLQFPNFAATKLLLNCGNRWIDVDAVDKLKENTALHIVSQSSKSDALPIVELLVNAGAHIDCLNKDNKTALDCAKTNEIRNFLQKKQLPVSLKCLCARYIATHRLDYKLILPAETSLKTFLYLHGYKSK